MKNRYIYIFSILSTLLAGGIPASAQSLNEAVRFSNLTETGTARSSALGGAFTALGGDMGAIFLNPASTGVFRNSELAVTLDVTQAKSASALTSSNGLSSRIFNNETRKTAFQPGHIGLVVTIPLSTKVKYINLGINYTKVNNFNIKHKRFTGYSPNSITHVYAAQSAGLAENDLNGFGAYPALKTFLINPKSDGGYFSILDYNDNGVPKSDPVTQNQLITEEGYQGEYLFSLGTNIMDKLYVGGSLGFQNVMFKYKSSYREAANKNAVSGLDFFDVNGWEQHEGLGFKLSFGAIYKINRFLRVGAAIHTPTWLNMDYDGYTETSAYYQTPTDPAIGRDGDTYRYASNLLSYSYVLKSAWRSNLGIAAVLNQNLILTADAGFTAYEKAKFRDDFDDETLGNGDPYAGLNNELKNTLKNRWNFAAGIEYRVLKKISLRYGYNIRRSPYKVSSQGDMESHNCGIGAGAGKFYADLSYTHRKYKNQTRFYDWNGIKSVASQNEYNSNIVKLSAGIRF